MTGSTPPTVLPDRDSGPFWEGVRAGEVRVQKCSHCGILRWPARAICNRCRSFDADWVALSGRGRIISWTRTHQIFHPAFADQTPYWNLLVRLDEQLDLQMIGQPDGPGWEPAAGMEVRAIIRETTPGTSLVFWRPCSHPGSTS